MAGQQGVKSRQYKIFMEEEKWSGIPGSIYEKACNFAQSLLHIEADEETKSKLNEAIEFANLKITPSGVASLTILFVLATILPIFILLITNLLGLFGLSLIGALLIMMLVMPFAYFLYIYPLHLRKRFEIKTGSDVVTLVLYMAVYMRNSPNMEGALRFAADNMRGVLAYELRKLLWDIEVGKYRSVDEALIQYAKKWKEEKEFIESIQLLRNSLMQTEDRRIQMLQEAVDSILNGTMEKADGYSRELKLPIMIIHAMGIVLPVMGLVLFPVIAVFLDIKPIALFVGYDVILPLILFFVIFTSLETRPPTFSTIDVSGHPDAPPKGKFVVNGKGLPVLPLSLMVTGVIVPIGAFLMLNDPSGEGLLGSIVIIIGLSLGPMLYFLLNSQQKLKIRKSVRDTESQFREALFQLGNQVSIGNPMEVAMQKAIGKIGDLDIKKLFERASQNIRNNGMTFKEAFFNKSYGALRYFPSKMIESIMRTIIEASKRGMNTASVAMITISNFLKRIKETQQKVEDSLSDVTSSLQFQAYFLSPLISGMIVTMAIVIIRILKQIDPQLQSAGGGMGGGMGLGFAQQLWSNIPITTGVFQLIVGIYMIETCIILGYFVNGIQNGEDRIGFQDIAGSALLFGTIIYVISFGITYMIFGGLIQGLL